MRFSPGSSGMPFGTAQETATPSRSRRRSQWSRVALCSWTTKRFLAESAPGSGPGSGVAPKLRLRRYSLSCSGVFLDLFVGVSIRSAAGLVLAFLGEAVERRRVLGVLGVVDQQVLGLLEALLLASAALVHGLERGVVAAVLVCLHGHDATRSAPGRTRPSQARGASGPAGSCPTLLRCPDRSSRRRGLRRCRARRARPSATPPRPLGRCAPAPPPARTSRPGS